MTAESRTNGRRRPRPTAMIEDDPGPDGADPVTRRHARSVFALAFALMALDFIDRQVVVATFPYLKLEWGLSDAQLGALVSIVSVTVAVGAFPVALLVDRWSRVKAIAIMGTTWSLAALASAFTQNLASSSPPVPWSGRVRPATHRPRALWCPPRTPPDSGRRSSARSRLPPRSVWCSGCFSAGGSPRVGGGAPRSASSRSPDWCSPSWSCGCATTAPSAPLPATTGRHPRSCASSSGPVPALRPTSAGRCSSWWSRRSTPGCRATWSGRTVCRPTAPPRSGRR